MLEIWFVGQLWLPLPSAKKTYIKSTVYEVLIYTFTISISYYNWYSKYPLSSICLSVRLWSHHLPKVRIMKCCLSHAWLCDKVLLKFQLIKQMFTSVYNDLYIGVQFWFLARLMLMIIIFWSWGRYNIRRYFHAGIRKYFTEFFLQFPRTLSQVDLQFTYHLRCIEHRFPSWFPPYTVCPACRQYFYTSLL